MSFPTYAHARFYAHAYISGYTRSCAGLITKLFEEDSITEDGKYTIKLFDLPSKEWKEYTIDDRLFTSGTGARFSSPSPDMEVCSIACLCASSCVRACVRACTHAC